MLRYSKISYEKHRIQKYGQTCLLNYYIYLHHDDLLIPYFVTIRVGGGDMCLTQWNNGGIMT
jgi:hypothetical protein